MNTSSVCRFRSAWAVALVLSAATAQADDDFSWRSSKPVRIRPSQTRTPQSAQQSPAEAARYVWDKVEYPQLVQQLNSRIQQAQADVEFWQDRLKRYEPLRFTDATQSAIKASENSLQASRSQLSELKQKLFLVQRYRVQLGQWRAQMLTAHRH